MRELGIGIVIALVLGIVFTASLLSRERGQHDATREALAVSRGQVSACATTLEAVNAATDDAKAEAARREQAGREAAQAALQAAREAGERKREAERELTEARRDPTCEAVLSTNICPRVPLL